MGSTTAARSWQRVGVLALGLVLVAACAVLVLLPLSSSFEVGDFTGSGASAGTRHVSFACGSSLLGKEYSEGPATAILGPGRSFLSNADLLNQACNKARFRRNVRVALLFASAVVVLAVGLVWPRRRGVRWAALTLGLLLLLSAIVVPVEGTLRW